ncbi:hypothetical protein Poly30_16590 [Planctomycetes bacterium Poly30]|uniref:SGNH hydrolase-type esterase domain-containing protein n=1 Tax=Saltatorellus ferox TaxID=2528018 RepID=A0A518EPY5_9BACT|nr:hypothetical protein Poly30_16590 [Planctomycetes bacterium Poly30]
MNYSRLAAFVLAAAAAGPPTLAALRQEAAPTRSTRPADVASPLLRDVRLIGASATDGFGNASELGTEGNVPLATFLSACLSDANAGVRLSEKSTSQFFMAPTVIGARQVTWARRGEPSLVVALDFLFWYGCGVDRQRDPRRMTGLEKGLQWLETIDCPLIIGTIPDVTHALDGKGPLGGPIIHFFQLPSEEDRLAMNARILEWASERQNVAVVDLSASFHAIVAGEAIEIRGQTWEVGDVTDALQPDFLHPNVDGSVMTALSVADAIARLEGAGPADFVFDCAVVKQRALERIEPLRERHAARMAARARRAAARGK